jgi:hypothetical protein
LAARPAATGRDSIFSAFLRMVRLLIVLSSGCPSHT